MPHEPSVLMYAEQLSDLEGVDGVSVSVVEQDDQTRTVEIVLEGANIPYEAAKGAIEQLGGSVHSVDHVSAGAKPVEGRLWEP